ncbi:PREDICTED: rRNA-processing protein EFG1-like isoform X2 [Amphimedon queenslandica]|uniref:rRNA-processing protein EFG1 n=1 Tax=Amphimedon queenslandica TaxID=400682 RepID=A0A1X7VRL6_AMPQE|nr:PREDICTED: rRNA-processing protein EFG1-like isoform X2 [Amphimedon queenslandica]|eukprot:XP_003383120.2 PREDICTED: rRNA-processing protein EFG1-like isoform X2 [Amphimedon queenslandica]
MEGVANVTMSSTGKKRKGLKQQLRDTNRLLSKSDLPETVRVSKERIAKLITQEIKEKEKKERDKKINKKYKMVKFFEKRKVTRKLKSLTKQLITATDEDREALLLEIDNLKKDLNYITYFPNGHKYISLYPTTSTSERSLQMRDDIYQSITRQVSEGTISDSFHSNSLCDSQDKKVHDKKLTDEFFM